MFTGQLFRCIRTEKGSQKLAYTLQMADFGLELDASILNDEPIQREKVLLWIESANDLSTLAKLYKLTGEAYNRIQPDLGMEVTCGLIQRYLLECIREDVSGDEEIEGRWEAARTLHVWFCPLLEAKGASAVLARAARAVTDLYVASGEEVRNAIEQGFLEHVLETVALRQYFENWASDPRLRVAWERALKWGEAHPDYTWGLLRQLRDKQRG